MKMERQCVCVEAWKERTRLGWDGTGRTREQQKKGTTDGTDTQTVLTSD